MIFYKSRDLTPSLLKKVNDVPPHMLKIAISNIHTFRCESLHPWCPLLHLLIYDHGLSSSTSIFYKQVKGGEEFRSLFCDASVRVYTRGGSAPAHMLTHTPRSHPAATIQQCFELFWSESYFRLEYLPLYHIHYHVMFIQPKLLLIFSASRASRRKVFVRAWPGATAPP